ncbi:MAG: Fic family protein [Lachnospiraceae bacterium]|nr:Fic family protein [Lachnospiraceae bacterium]
MENKIRAGKFVTNLSGDMAYQSFLPASLPPVPPINIDEEMTQLLISAHSQLTLLDGLTKRIPNMQLFVSMYVRKEALLSSQIEGTQATLDDILDPLLEENVNRDVADVVNYIRAVDFAIHRLQSLPLCNRLVRETHAVLMENVRGQEKNPGEFRCSQNWIGGQGSTLRNARYIPPNPQDMIESMSDLEKFINAEDSIDHLIRIALIHYQFETIHPFLDGNGRIGRLIITLYLMENHVLSSPTLYLSWYLKQNRVEYYDRMSEVRRTGDYEQWVRFFLRAVAASAEDAIQTIDQLSALHNSNRQLVTDSFGTRSVKNAMQLFSYLEQNPIIDIQKTAAALNMAYNTAARYVADFCRLGILLENTKRTKARVYSYEQYLKILREDT